MSSIRDEHAYVKISLLTAQILFAHSARAVEYVDCIFAEE